MTSPIHSARVVLALAAVFVVACDNDDGATTYSVQFDVVVSDTPFRCGQSYPNMGSTSATISPRDIRMFVHDVALLGASGTATPLALYDDGVWQRDGIALLDFADDTGACETGSPATNDVVLGTAAIDEDIVGVSFRIGIPAELNHIDAARAPAPLNAAGMAWSWTGGYKYARIDVTTDNNPAWYIHLGATKCEGNPVVGVSCAFSNLAAIEVESAASGMPAVVLDMAKVYAGSDLNAPIDYQTDFVNGCMAFGGDPECPAVFDALGLTFESDRPLAARAFSGQ